LRFLFLTDTHIRGTTPRNRTDNLALTLQAKMQEVNTLAAQYQVDAVLHNGDLFDRPDIAPSVVGDFAGLLRRCPAPIYLVAGNHDIFGQNPDTLGRTMLGLLDRFGVVRLLVPGQPVFLQQNGLTVQLTGQHFHYLLDRRSPELDYCVTKDPRADFAIHMVHGMLLEKPFIPGIAHTLIEQVLTTGADITLCGHYHHGYDHRRDGIIAIDGKYFINPGSLVRINNSLQEMTRQPRVILIDLSGPEPRFTPLPLTSAKPGEEVLDRSGLEAAESREHQLAEFVRGVQAAGDFQLFGVNQIIRTIAANQGIPEAVRHEAIRRISLTQQLLSITDGDQPAD
jgi:DNA repair protein SbcD/Mre11